MRPGFLFLAEGIAVCCSDSYRLPYSEILHNRTINYNLNSCIELRNLTTGIRGNGGKTGAASWPRPFVVFSYSSTRRISAPIAVSFSISRS